MRQRLLSIVVVAMLLLTAVSPLALYAAGTWENVGTPGFSAGTASFVSLALDSANVPYVAYQDAGNDYKATVMKFSNGSWHPVGDPGFSANLSPYISLALDRNNVPYVAYQDAGSSQKITVMKFTDTSWQAVRNVGFSAGIASYISLALDSNNRPYVSYLDGSQNDKATVMHYNESTWVYVGSAGFSAAEAYYTSLALSSANVPYVAYRDAGNDNKATVMRLNGSAWEVVGAAGFSAGAASYTSLALSSADVPFVAFQDAANGNRVTVMRYDSASKGWEIVGTAGFSQGAAAYTSLALAGNNSDVPYVAYQDGGNLSKATVMRYDNPTAVTLTAFEASWQGEAMRVSWETAQELDHLGFHLYRSAAPAGPWVRLSEVLIPAQQPGSTFGAHYEWIDADVMPGEPLYYRLEAVDIHGASTFYGPVEAIANEAAVVSLSHLAAHSRAPAVIGMVLGLLATGLAVFGAGCRPRRRTACD